MIQRTECPVCRRPGTGVGDTDDHNNNYHVQCESCGEFEITGQACRALPGYGESHDENDKLVRHKLVRWLYETRYSDRLRLVMHNSVSGITGERLVLDCESAKEQYKDDGLHPQMCQNTVNAMGALTMLTSQQEYLFPQDRWLVKATDESEAGNVLADLVEQGFLSGSGSLADGEFRLTLKGWGCVEQAPPAELEQRRIGFDQG